MRSLVLGVCVLSGFTPLLVAQDAAVHVIEADEGTANWVVQESTGRIFASVKTSDVVVEYGVEGSKLREFPVGGEPDEMLIKAPWLVVGCKKSKTLHVIDLTKNEVIGSVLLQGKGPRALFASRAANPYVYCICNTGDSSGDGEVFQIDLREMKIRKRAEVLRWGSSYPTHVAMSADGNWIVTDARGYSSPSGADLMQVDEEALTFEQARNHHDSFGQIIAGPNNRFWTLGNLLFPLNISASSRKFAGSPVAIHPQWNLAVSYSSSSLHFESFDNANLLKKVSLPSASPPVDATPPRSRYSRSSSSRTPDRTLQFDLKNNRVFLGDGARGYSVDLRGLGIDYQPLLLIAAPSSARVNLGTTLRIPLDVTNPSLADSTTLRVVSAPDGVGLEENQLVWTPQRSQVGAREIVIEATSGTLKDSLTLSVSVDTPDLELDFKVVGTAADPAGKYLAVWGPNTSAASTFRTPADTPVEFAVVDWKNKTLLVQRNLTSGLRAALLDDKYLYLSPSSGNLIYRLNPKDLGDAKRLFLNGTVTNLAKLNADTLAVFGTIDNRTTFTTYDRETLKKRPSSPETAGSIHVPPHLRPGFRTLSKTHRELEQRVIDAQTGEFLYAISSGQLPSLAPTSARPAARRPIQNPPERAWGRGLAFNRLTNHAGTRIATWEDSVSRFSLDYPVIVSVRSDAEPGILNYYLELRELTQGEVVFSSLIDVWHWQRTGSSYYEQNQPDRLRVRGDRVVFARWNTLLFAELPEDVLAKTTPPVHFRLPGRSVYGTDKPVKLKVAADGGSGALSYSLAFEYPGLELDEKTGEVTLDVPTMWNTFVSNIATTMSDYRVGPTLRGQLEQNGTQYERLTGLTLPAGKLAMVLPISATVTDVEGQEDHLTFYPIVLADRTVIDRAMAEYKKEQAEAQEKKRQEAEALRRQQMAERERQQETAEGSRLDQLDQRVRRLEAAIDAILLKLEKLEDKES